MSQVALTTCAEPLVLNFLKKFFTQSYGDDFFYLRLIFVDVLPFVLSFCISSLNVTLSPRYCILQDWSPPQVLKYLIIISKQQTFINNLFNFKFGVQYFNLI